MVARAATAGIARAVDRTFILVDGDVAFCLASGEGEPHPFASCRSEPLRPPPRPPDPRRGRQAARPDAVRAVRDPLVRARTVKTQAVVLRSIRYGEADRILHLYSATRGKVGAIAKGSRRPKCGSGQAGAVLPAQPRPLRGAGRAADGDRRLDGGRLRAAAVRRQGADGRRRGCDAVLRLFGEGEANQPAYNLLCNYLALLDADPAAASEPGPALAFRLKLALAAGFTPELASCARCGEADHLSAFSGAAGGVVCSSCEGDGFPFTEQAHRFMVEALVGRSRRRRRPGARSRPCPTAR